VNDSAACYVILVSGTALDFMLLTRSTTSGGGARLALDGGRPGGALGVNDFAGARPLVIGDGAL
jgi:hypothetical protein